MFPVELKSSSAYALRIQLQLLEWDFPAVVSAVTCRTGKGKVLNNVHKRIALLSWDTRLICSSRKARAQSEFLLVALWKTN